jgi:hypothetical protein
MTGLPTQYVLSIVSADGKAGAQMKTVQINRWLTVVAITWQRLSETLNAASLERVAYMR